MPRHVRYMLLQLGGPLLVMTASLAGVVGLTQSLRFVDLMINKGLSIGLFLYMTLLLMPWFLAAILAIAVFVAILYAYHRLITDSELVVLRAVGLSNLSLALPGLIAAGAAMLVGYSINFYFMPAGFRAFKDLQFEIRHSVATLLLQEGVFNTPVDGLTVYIRERESDGGLRGILVHDEREAAQPSTIMAERGMLVRTEAGPRFVVENGNRQQIKDGQLSLLYFDRYAFDFAPAAAKDASRFRTARERYVGDLFAPTDVVDPRHRREFLAEGHQRLVGPLTGPVLALIALVALLSGESDRRGYGKRIMIAAGVGTVFQTLVFALSSAMVEVPAITPLYYLLVLGGGVIGYYLLYADPFRLRASRTAAQPAATL